MLTALGWAVQVGLQAGQVAAVPQQVHLLLQTPET